MKVFQIGNYRESIFFSSQFSLRKNLIQSEFQNELLEYIDRQLLLINDVKERRLLTIAGANQICAQLCVLRQIYTVAVETEIVVMEIVYLLLLIRNYYGVKLGALFSSKDMPEYDTSQRNLLSNEIV